MHLPAVGYLGNPGYNQSSICKTHPNNCMEANLDIQYIMAMSQNTPTYVNLRSYVVCLED